MKCYIRNFLICICCVSTVIVARKRDNIEFTKPISMLRFSCTAFNYKGKDEIHSPQIMQSILLGGEIDYEFRSLRNNHIFEIGFGFGRPKGSVKTERYYLDYHGNKISLGSENMQIEANLRYTYHRSIIRNLKSKVNFHIGTGLSVYENIIGASGLTWFGAYSLNMSMLLNKRFSDKHALSTQLFLPVLTKLVRPPWSTLDNDIIENEGSGHAARNAFIGEYTSFKNFFLITSKTRYEHAILPKFRAHFQYEISYYKTSIPLNCSAINNNFSLGLTMIFNRREK